MTVLTLVVLALCSSIANGVDGQARKEAYLEARGKLMAKQDGTSSLSCPLSDKEQILNKKLIKYRDEYIHRTKKDHTFPPHHYFYSWDLNQVETSSDALFQFIKTLPKGGALHLHSGSSGSVDWILDEGIYIDGCHVYFGEDDLSRCIEPLGGQEVACGETATAAPLYKGTISFYKNGTQPKGFSSAKDLVSTFDTFKDDLRGLLTSNGSLQADDSAQVS